MTLRPPITDSEFKTVVLLGGGNVATHLAKALRQLPGYRLVYHYMRSLGMKLEDIPPHADLYLFALSDAALPEVWQAMPSTRGVWIHLAGSVELSMMQSYHSACGVLYPLQTFSKKRPISWETIPIYYEGDTEAELLAGALSRHTAFADSQGRAKLHLAAVVACNFSNYLISLAEDYLQTEGFDPKSLMPLLAETFAKLESLPAREAQTGPAIRRDHTTLSRHLSMLPEGDMLAVYRLLSEQLLHR